MPRAASSHSATLSEEQNAVVCFLRENHSIAKSYGIKSIDGHTSVGSMLMQTLEAQGCGISWYERHDVPAGATANQKGAAWIRSMSRRPVKRMKQLTERPEVMPPPNAAVVKAGESRGKVSIKAIPKSVAAARPRKAFTASGNRRPLHVLQRVVLPRTSQVGDQAVALLALLRRRHLVCAALVE